MSIQITNFAQNKFTTATSIDPSKTSVIAAIAWERSDYSGIEHNAEIVAELNEIIDAHEECGWNDDDAVMQQIIAEVEQRENLTKYINEMLQIPEFIEDTGEVSGAW